jgi:uncharacterized protein YraI
MRYKFLISLLAALVMLIGVVTAVQAQQGTWYGQYFNNRYFLDAVVSRQDSSVNFDWGGGSPVNGVNADVFSVRWSRTYTLGSGTYQMTARADDGIRVTVDSVPYIDDLFPGSGRQHNVVFTLMSGEHDVVVEYQENTGNAFINFEFSAFVAPTAPPTNTAPPGVTPSFSPATIIPTLVLTGPIITVATGELNVRSLPNTNSRIVTVIRRFERYPIIGRSIDGLWYQIIVDNLRIVGTVVGWVSADWVFLDRAENVPVTYGYEGEPILTDYYLRTTTNVMFRTAPSTDALAIGVLFGTVRVQIAGITSDYTWWLVYIEGYLGWVHRDFVQLEQDVDYGQIPIVDDFVADYPFD